MTRETMIILKVAGVAALTFAWFCYWFMKDGLPAWSIGVVAVFVLFFTVVALHGYLPSAEEKLAARLEADNDARATSGTVLSVQRLGTLESETTRRCRIGLTVDMTVEGGSRQVTLDLWVEDALLPDFASGRSIHLLYDKDDDSRVAIDRRHTPVSIR